MSGPMTTTRTTTTATPFLVRPGPGVAPVATVGRTNAAGPGPGTGAVAAVLTTGIRDMLTVAPVVHTTGVNWQSIAVILGGFGAFTVAIGGFIGWVLHRVEASRSRTEEFVTTKVKEVADTLAERLGDINNHLERQDEKIDDTRDKVMRLTGRIRRGLW